MPGYLSLSLTSRSAIDGSTVRPGKLLKVVKQDSQLTGRHRTERIQGRSVNSLRLKTFLVPRLPQPRSYCLTSGK